MTDWKPISTAPKNWAVLIAGGTHITIAEWSLTEDDAVEWWTTDDLLPIDANGSHLTEWQPTHWMHLPTLPDYILDDSDGDDCALGTIKRQPTLAERWRIIAKQFWVLGRTLRTMPSWIWMAIDPKTTATEESGRITITSANGFQSSGYPKPTCPSLADKVD